MTRIIFRLKLDLPLLFMDRFLGPLNLPFTRMIIDTWERVLIGITAADFFIVLWIALSVYSNWSTVILHDSGKGVVITIMKMARFSNFHHHETLLESQRQTEILFFNYLDFHV